MATEATDLGAQLERRAAPKDRRTVLDLIEQMRPEIEKSLQSEQGAAMLARHYYNAIRYNELLRQCSPDSLVAALLLSAQVRLEPGPLGHVYLVPFMNKARGVHEVVWMLGYTGIIELGRRGGAAGLTATVAYDGDEVERPWQNERGWHWRLVPTPEEQRGDRIGVLVTWKEERERMALWCPPERVDAAVKASRHPKASELRGEDWYWRKTAVRFARPWLPLTTDSARFGLAARADGALVHYVSVTSEGEAEAVIEDGGEE
jgi:phage RecT family recombinase